MELFTVNRYKGDAYTEDNPEKEDQILKNLIKKAKKRKREIEIVEDNITEKSNIENEDDEGKQEKVEKSTKEDKIQTEAQESKSHNEISDLKILGDNLFHKKQKIDIVLPSWLAYPTILVNKISDNDETSILVSELKFLSTTIKDALESLKIEKLFPVQNEVIPWVLDSHLKPPPFRPRDLCVSAPTGSGKTLTFAIPIVQILSKRVERKIRALILLPVHELATQIYYVFKKLTHKTNLSVCLLSKSHSLAAEQQRLVDYYNNKYYSKVDIVVTTPGRLVEHIHSTKGFCLDNLKFLVIDEADKIMEQIHHDWLYHLDNHIKNKCNLLLSGKSNTLCANDLINIAYNQPHKMLFSATLSQDPEKLQKLGLFQPKLFTTIVTNTNELIDKFNKQTNNELRGEFIGKYTKPSELTEKYCITESQLKPLTLYSLIKENSWNKFLCFTNSAESAHRLSYVLLRLFQDESIAELSANLKPFARTKILNSFAIGQIKGLISSDALSRGIDIPNVDIVISYEMPRHIKTYIHRVGRTARAGRPGTAITILSPKEFITFKKILTVAEEEPELDEIKVESNIETENAKLYSNILRSLKKELEKEKKLKILHKNVLIKKAAVNKIKDNSNKISTMERLQIQANEIVAGDLEKRIESQGKRSIKRKNKVEKVKKQKSDKTE